MCHLRRLHALSANCRIQISSRSAQISYVHFHYHSRGLLCFVLSIHVLRRHHRLIPTGIQPTQHQSLVSQRTYLLHPSSTGVHLRLSSHGLAPTNAGACLNLQRQATDHRFTTAADADSFRTSLSHLLFQTSIVTSHLWSSQPHRKKKKEIMMPTRINPLR